MEDYRLSLTDDSRPSFQRPKYTIGIYLSALDAVADKDTVVGSHHAFMMTVTDTMLDHFHGLDLANVKGALERRHIFDGVLLDGFRNGCVLVVSFDSAHALEHLWALYMGRRLTAVIQEILVDKTLLRATHTVKLILRAKLWEDEYKACKEELTDRSPSRLQLRDFEHDLDMVNRVKRHQKVMPDIISKAKDAESRFERSLGEFMLTVKRSLPDTVNVVRNLGEFCVDIKVAKGVKKTEFEPVDKYLETLDFFRKVFKEVEESIVHPLCQVRLLCEKDRQVKLKKSIKEACTEMLTKLRPDSDLQKIRYKEWELKVLPREHGLFYGLISLIPMCLDRLTTIDLNTDEYITDFPEMADC